jgi:FkbM family methyltransferase
MIAAVTGDRMSLIGRMLPDALRYRAWCWKKYLGEPEIRLAARLARPGSRCLDIGANAGAYSYFMRRAGAAVEAFEPIPELAADLRRRYGDSIRVHELAASDGNGRTTIHVPVIDGQPAYGYSSCENVWPHGGEMQLSIETRTIDSFAFDDVALMKIDVEGHELAVLHGARETIARNKPAIIIEAEERHRSGAVESVASFLAPFGYKGKYLVKAEEISLEHFDTHRDQAKPEAPGYVCNFIF